MKLNSRHIENSLKQAFNRIETPSPLISPSRVELYWVSVPTITDIALTDALEVR